jgi:pilus assembly protein CpaB
MLLAVAVAFGAAPLINKAADQKVDVVCIAADIPQGRVITEDNLKIVTVGAYNLSSKAIKDKAHAIGRFAATDLKEDAILLDTKITEDANGAEDIFRTLDGTKQAISITLDGFAGGLSGKLKNGDIVSVITTIENKTAIPAELKYVRVITTTSSSGNDAGDANKDGETELPSTVTLLVNDIQATILAENEVNGKLHLSLVYRGDSETAEKFLDAQEQVFLQLEIGQEAQEPQEGPDEQEGADNE